MQKILIFILLILVSLIAYFALNQKQYCAIVEYEKKEMKYHLTTSFCAKSKLDLSNEIINKSMTSKMIIKKITPL